jgi:hypothetical protein
MDKIKTEKVIESLKRFNLSQEEAELYVQLPQIEALNVETIAEKTNLSIDEVQRIMLGLEKKGFVKTFMAGLYVPRTPIESLDAQLTDVYKTIHEMKNDIISILQPRFIQDTLVACNLDRAHFNILVNRLTKMATGTIRISAKEMKFIEESDFLNALTKNRKLTADSVEILLTAHKDTPEWGDIVFRIRELVKSKKVCIKHNRSRTQLRYMTVRTKNKRIALLVNSEHQNAIIIKCDEVANYFNENFRKYFRAGKDIELILEDLKGIKNPRDKDKEVLEILKTKGHV